MSAPSDDLIAFCITEALGERCATHDPDCYTCQAWAEYDRAASLRKQVEELTRYKRLQSEDIMTLGQQVGAAEAALAEAVRHLSAVMAHPSNLPACLAARTFLSRHGGQHD